MQIATKLPITAIHQGDHGGSVSASNQPASAAEPSPRVARPPPPRRRHASSNNIALPTVISHIHIAGQPKR